MITKQNINIKGTRDGLIFLINDHCSFDDVISELKDKLENSYNDFLKGPLTRVIIKTGYRKLLEEQQEVIKEIFKAKGNLRIHSIENEIDLMKLQLKNQAKVYTGVIRSGQSFEFDGNVLVIGDVNPGGFISAIGDIYVLGALKGIAHAGSDGNKDAIIAASIMEPTQLRIENLIRTQFEDNLTNEFAYINETQIVLNKFHRLPRERKGTGILLFKEDE